MTHGAFLNAAKHAARLVRDRFKRRGEVEARQILAAARLQDDPLARMVARQIGRLESKVRRLEEFHERRGHFNARGELKPSVLTEAKFIGDLLGEARRLFELLQERGSERGPEDGVYRCELSDASPAFSPLSTEGRSTMPGPPEEGPPIAAGAAQGMRLESDEDLGPPDDESLGVGPPSPPPPRPQPPKPPRRPTPAEELGWITVAGQGDPDGY